ncbi:MAG TPA: beta-hexosaminidase [Caldithrix abyssi]|uniref:Beta-hexosaminidase n=1 Tax=Caldithrix abyssi TaxID=187145 RepID=A0A7V4U0S2_CALAY|nr:beta-hexosaminidase [Caldithrix abyssi]
MKKPTSYLTYLLIAVFTFCIYASEEKVMDITKPSWQNLMPVPKQVQAGTGLFRLDSSFAVRVTGKPDKRIYKGVARMIHRLAGRTGLFLPQSFFSQAADTVKSARMIIRIQRPGKIRFGEDESYTLNISPNTVELLAVTDIGALRGLETFLQLLDADEVGYFFPAVKIEDAPRFPWRGLLIDACRHFMPVEVIKRNLDGMAAAKMNVLHWHLSEDQGFRVESKTFPKLHELGSDGMYYTQAQIKDIIRYAADRGIRVMPEFDVPGHATSWLTAYPELASLPGPYRIERRWGVHDPTFNPAIEETYTFLDAFFKEMAALFPDEYFHIGGDENNGKQWDANPQIQAFMKKHNIEDNHALQSYFNNRLLKILTKYNKKMVGWDEILHPDMPTNIVIQSWRGRKAMIQAAQEGYQTILSNGYYIDLIQSTEYHYLNDPAPDDLPLNDQQRKLILGGEATMWAEMVSPETIDSRIWPRTGAIAERLWSPDSVKDVEDMYRRLKFFSFHLEELGLTHEKNYGMMLRRLANGQNTRALQNLVDVLEPVKMYQRHHLRKHFSYTPLTRVVDAARPDAETARNFRKLVSLYLSNPAEHQQEKEQITEWLRLWKSNHTRLEKIIRHSPILREIEKHSQNLSRCAEIGLQALALLNDGETADPSWLEQSATILQEAKTPHGQTELMILPAIEALLEEVK